MRFWETEGSPYHSSVLLSSQLLAKPRCDWCVKHKVFLCHFFHDRSDDHEGERPKHRLCAHRDMSTGRGGIRRHMRRTE